MHADACEPSSGTSMSATRWIVGPKSSAPFNVSNEIVQQLMAIISIVDTVTNLL